MNLIKNFENRVSEAFGAAPHGYDMPFSFKRLAKEAAKQLEAETFIIDGIDTAPALYTILVSASDDASMRVLYPQITLEVVRLVKAQAQNKGYAFVGEPLARFLVDPKLRSGKFAVFAENVDAVTLEHLRAEEQAFLSGASAVGGAAADREAAKKGAKKPKRRIGFGRSKNASAADDELSPVVPKPSRRRPSERKPAAEPAAAAAAAAAPVAAAAAPVAAAVEPIVAASVQPVVSADVQPIMASVQPVVTADVAPVDPFDIITPSAAPVVAAAPVMTPTPISPDDSVSMGLDIVPADYLDSNVQASHLAVPAIDVPMTQRKTDPVSAPAQGDYDGGQDPATCLLVDRQTGYTYMGTAPRTGIGRERVTGNIILRDPNVSRRHAELTFDGSVWTLRDLGSTNGTLVNDVEISQCVLHDGDLVTVGLMNLEFREA